MKKKLTKIGCILFFIGIILIIISWLYSYPIRLTPKSTDIYFFQFYPSLWPGLLLSFIGLFLIIFNCKNKIIMTVCSAVFPLLLYICPFFYSYIPSPDAGAVRGFFHVFQNTGINSEVIPYFEFPNYFCLNEIIRQIAAINDKSVAVISFIIYGVLLGLFLFIFFDRLKTRSNNEFSPVVLVVLYFIGMVSFINYQWAPQTLALVYFFILIVITTNFHSESSEIKWTFIFILIFIALVLVHAFISVIFLSFFTVFSIKRRYLLKILLLIFSIYIIYTSYVTTVNLPQYIETFRHAIVGINSEYTAPISTSFKEPEGVLNQLISFSNRLIIPMVWLISVIGIAILFLKRKIEFVLISLGFSGGIYLAVGFFFSVLGLRAVQVLLIPIVTGFLFFSSKWKKPTVAFIMIVFILSVSIPMRNAYDNTQFQVDEEVDVCNFLVNKTINSQKLMIAINQVNWGYFVTKWSFIKKTIPPYAVRPGQSDFLYAFNASLNTNQYIFYNSNLGKEIIVYELSREQLNSRLRLIIDNNKIYDCGLNFIINGLRK